MGSRVSHHAWPESIFGDSMRIGSLSHCFDQTTDKSGFRNRLVAHSSPQQGRCGGRHVRWVVPLCGMSASRKDRNTHTQLTFPFSFSLGPQSTVWHDPALHQTVYFKYIPFLVRQSHQNKIVTELWQAGIQRTLYSCSLTTVERDLLK